MPDLSGFPIERLIRGRGELVARINQDSADLAEYERELLARQPAGEVLPDEELLEAHAIWNRISVVGAHSEVSNPPVPEPEPEPERQGFWRRLLGAA
jgi:hypothetical protein